MDPRTTRIRTFFQSGAYLQSRAPIRARVEIVRELLGDLNGTRILDLGCGDGSLSLQYAATNSITLVDLSPNMLERARENTPAWLREHVRYVNAAADALPIDERFDVVLCIGLLAHVASVDRTVATVGRLLQRGGRCIFQITDDDRWMGRALKSLFSLRMKIWDSGGYDFTKVGCAELTKVAANHGLRRVDERRTWSILPGMKFMPDDLLLRYLRVTGNSPFLSSRGAEAFILFSAT